MRFDITHRVHFGYMREKGPHYDLSEADMDNLEAGGFGHRAPGNREVEIERGASEATTGDQPPDASLPGGAGPNDSTERSDGPPAGPFTCETCKRDFSDTTSPAISLKQHRISKRH